MKHSRTNRRIIAAALAASMALTGVWGISAAAADSGPSVAAPSSYANPMDRYVGYGSAEVDAFTGALHLSKELQFGQFNHDMPFGLYYDSQQSENQGFGYGVRSLFGGSLEKISEDAYLYQDYTGKTATFEKDPVTGEYTDVLGRTLYMGDQNWISIQPLGSNYPSLAFLRETGKLFAYVVGYRVPTINMYYDDEGLLVNAVASTGAKYFTFAYEQGASGEKLCSSVNITTNLGTAGYRFTYDAQNRLQGIDYTGQEMDTGALYRIEYDEDGLPQHVTDNDSTQYAFAYQTIDGTKKLTNLSVYYEDSSNPIASYQLAYGKDQTIVIDQNGLMKVIRFDGNGNVIE